VNVTVTIYHKEGYWNCAMKDYQDFSKFKYESFFVLAFYVDEATCRHVHIQGRNTTKKAMPCNV